MSIFKSRKKFRISERDPEFKVRYLGNVQTAMMKGEGCVDKATNVLWNNFAKSGGTVGLDMTITVCASGMKALTNEQGLTEYRAYRISYCIAHPSYPRLFVWVYRHEGKRMKVELRCHAVLCKNERKAKAMALALHDKLQFSLNEFMRDKKRRQNSRLTLQKTNSLTSLPTSTNTYGTSLRQKMLSTGQKFKPSIEQSSTAPKLGNITESFEAEKREEALALACITEAEEEEEEPEEEPDTGIEVDPQGDPTTEVVIDMCTHLNGDEDADDDSSISMQNEGADQNSEDGSIGNEDFGLEIGNDLDELKRDARNAPDSDSNSSESGFSEQDNKESSSTGSVANGKYPSVNTAETLELIESLQPGLTTLCLDTENNEYVPNGDISTPQHKQNGDCLDCKTHISKALSHSPENTLTNGKSVLQNGSTTKL